MSAGFLRPVSTIVLGFALVAPTVSAQEATVRVRGTIERAEGDTYFVKSRDGAELRLKLAPKASVVALTQASLADIKQGSYVGVANPRPGNCGGLVCALATTVRGTPANAGLERPLLGCIRRPANWHAQGIGCNMT